MFGGDSIDDFAALFIDPTHKLCGKIGRIIEADYSEGRVTVVVVDQGKHNVPYGHRDEDGRRNSPIHVFGRHRDEEHQHRKEEPDQFMAAYLECNRGNIADLQTQYKILFGEQFETLLEYKKRTEEERIKERAR